MSNTHCRYSTISKIFVRFRSPRNSELGKFVYYIYKLERTDLLNEVVDLYIQSLHQFTVSMYNSLYESFPLNYFQRFKEFLIISFNILLIR